MLPRPRQHHAGGGEALVGGPGPGGQPAVQYRTVQNSTVQYSTVQYSTVQYSIVQYSTVQYSTIYPMFMLSEDGRQDTGDCVGVESVEAVVRNYEVRGEPCHDKKGKTLATKHLWFNGF